jgi:nicotinic acid mononucleotide adenylyltransferase
MFPGQLHLRIADMKHESVESDELAQAALNEAHKELANTHQRCTASEGVINKVGQ